MLEATAGGSYDFSKLVNSFYYDGVQYFLFSPILTSVGTATMNYCAVGMTVNRLRYNGPQLANLSKIRSISFYVDKTTGEITNIQNWYNTSTQSSYPVLTTGMLSTGLTTDQDANLKINTNVVALKSDIPEPELPAIAAGDEGKVLTVNSTEDGVEWANAGGGTTYTAGNGIDITNDVISLNKKYTYAY